ncbi:MAG TPA: diguanylate cyclase [Sulfuricurvum sp.]|nr:diguanylate cyclase [Sulfuricurvum sp.]
MKILLLEDDAALNRAIKKVLELDHNNKVESFLDGKAVLNVLDYPYDLYIMDVNVPNINGLDLLRVIHDENNLAKVIIISSNADLKTLQEAYALGCVDYIKKPFHLDELRIKIDKLNIPRKHLSSRIKLKNDSDALTKKERDLLNLLLDNQETVVTYALIEEHVYKDHTMSMDALRALVRRLRSKLADDIIKNVLDEGYSVSDVPVFLNENLEQNAKQRIQELEIENNELKLEKEALAKMSMTDPLTGLYNRVKVEETFLYEQKQSIRHDDPLSIILMDLDYFKSINDVYGHNIGDVFLKEIAQLLRELFRTSDVIARWGGEEFLIVLPKTDLNTARKLALKLKDHVQETKFTDIGQRTASYGVAMLVDEESLTSIVKRADLALYLAKDNGRNRVEIANA